MHNNLFCGLSMHASIHAHTQVDLLYLQTQKITVGMSAEIVPVLLLLTPQVAGTGAQLCFKTHGLCMVVHCILLNKVLIYKHVKEQYTKERENFEWVQRWSIGK
jgi:hypothetical protein